jgi:hypothetical protein
VATLAQGLLLAGVDPLVHYLNSNGMTLNFSKPFSKSALLLQPAPLSKAASTVSLRYIDCETEVHEISVDLAVLRGDLRRDATLGVEEPF